MAGKTHHPPMRTLSTEKLNAELAASFGYFAEPTTLDTLAAQFDVYSKYIGATQRFQADLPALAGVLDEVTCSGRLADLYGQLNARAWTP